MWKASKGESWWFSVSKQHSFSVAHARLYGLREAVLIHNLHFWIDHNHANGTHHHDGRTWTYNSVKAFERLFPYLTGKQIRTSLETLVTLGVLLRGNYNEKAMDRTAWFAFTDEFLAGNPLSAPPQKQGQNAPEGTCICPQGQLSNIEQIVNIESAKLLKPLSALPSCPYQSILDCYHDTLPELPAVHVLGAPRKKAIASFWKFVLTSKKTDGTHRAIDVESALAWIRQYFERASCNDFLMGRTARGATHAGWQCDIDFLISEKGRIQVIEKTRAAT